MSPTTSSGDAPLLPTPAQPRTPRSPNVTRTLVFNFIDGACYSMWAMQLLPVFLLHTSANSVMVGFSASASGVSQLLGALATGCVADKLPRRHSIVVGAACGAVALAVFLMAFWTARVWLVLCAQVLWGLYSGIVSTSVEALFADSVPTGQRTRLYNVKWIVQTVCYVVGYAAAALLFAVWGNTWDLQRVRVAMTLGVAVHPLALVPLCALQDRHAVEKPVADDVGEEEDAATARAAAEYVESNTAAPPLAPPPPLLQPTTAAATAAAAAAAAAAPSSVEAALTHAVLGGTRFRSTEQLPISASTEGFGVENDADADAGATAAGRAARLEGTPHSAQAAPPPQSATTAASTARASTVTRSGDVDDARWQRRGRGAPLRCRWRELTSLAAVPYWMCAVDLLLAIGSGMSLPYLPLFFATDLHVSPAGLNALYIASTLLTAATSSSLPLLLHFTSLGRVPVALAVRLAGTLAFGLLATASPSSTAASMPATVALFLCRNALMNSVFGVTRSVIMDCVCKEHRAKWSAVESVSSFSWAGSAVIGGYVTRRHGYRATFAATAVVQLTATLLMTPAALGARALDSPASEGPPLLQAVEEASTHTSPTDTLGDTPRRRR